MRVAFLYNVASEDPTNEVEDANPDRSPIVEAIERLGHQVTPIACTLDLSAIRSELARVRPDVAFNRVESLGGTDSMAAAVTVLLDAMKIPYTGNSTPALVTTASKIYVKERLRRAGLPTPDWIAADQGLQPDTNGRFILKSTFEHDSFELDDSSIVSPSGKHEAINLLHYREVATGHAHFAEEFIDGREFNVSLLGPAPQVLPPVEIDFSTFPPHKERIVGHSAKCDENSFEYQNTERIFDFPLGDQRLLQQLSGLAVDCWRLFELSGYARVDFRVDRAQRPWILEINANPCTLPDAGFAAALENAGIDYDDAIAAILSEAVDRFRRSKEKPSLRSTSGV